MEWGELRSEMHGMDEGVNSVEKGSAAQEAWDPRHGRYERIPPHCLSITFIISPTFACPPRGLCAQILCLNFRFSARIWLCLSSTLRSLRSLGNPLLAFFFPDRRELECRGLIFRVGGGWFLDKKTWAINMCLPCFWCSDDDYDYRRPRYNPYPPSSQPFFPPPPPHHHHPPSSQPFFPPPPPHHHHPPPPPPMFPPLMPEAPDHHHGHHHHPHHHDQSHHQHHMPPPPEHHGGHHGHHHGHHH